MLTFTSLCGGRYGHPAACCRHAYGSTDMSWMSRAGELRKHGVRLRLRGQPLQVLEILLERSGEVVTRAEFQTRIWTADTFVDFDHSLHNAIARIREVLGDSAETPRYIETLPRRGYRYIGPVQDFQRLPVAPQNPAAIRLNRRPS